MARARRAILRAVVEGKMGLAGMFNIPPTPTLNIQLDGQDLQIFGQTLTL